MIERARIIIEVDVDVSHLAEQFAALTDDAQAQFICMAAAKLGSAMNMQAFYVGNHLRTCQCSTPQGREFITEIAKAMEKTDA